MATVILIPILIFLILLGGLLFSVSPGFDLPTFYAAKLQTPLFIGFLTIGGFLLSLKTFILVKLKEDLYDSPVYLSRYQERKCLNADLTLYGPLKRIGNFLIYCVLGALVTSSLQFSLGFIEHRVASAVCMSVAGMTLSLVFMAWWLIRQNLNTWFDLLVKSAECKFAPPE